MATMIDCRPVRTGMTTFLISTQTIEQYGDCGSIHTSYFKPKGGNDYIIHTNGRVWDAIAYVSMLIRQDDDLNDPPIDYKVSPQYYYELVNHWEEVELNHPISYEKYIRDDMDQEDLDELLEGSKDDRLVYIVDKANWVADPDGSGDWVELPLPTEEEIASVHAYWTMNNLKWRLDGLR
jgi:hypothetical protein